MLRGFRAPLGRSSRLSFAPPSDRTMLRGPAPAPLSRHLQMPASPGGMPRHVFRSSPQGLEAPSSKTGSTTTTTAATTNGVLTQDAIPLKFSDGMVTADSVGVLLSNLSPLLNVNEALSQGGGLVLGMKSDAGDVSILDITLGRLKPSRMLAIARCKLWWMTPEWMDSTLSIPAETQFLLVDLSPPGNEGEGPYAIMLPLIDHNFRGTLLSGRGARATEGDITLRVESGDDTVRDSAWGGVLYVAASWEPYELMERGVAYAAKLSGGAKPRVEKAIPPSLDYFGWCTWDAFYSSVSARGLQEGLDGLAEGGIRPRTLIIDDGWQMTDVDQFTRKAPTGDLAEALRLDIEARELLLETEGEFYLEEMEVIATTAADLPGGTSIGSIFPALSDIGAETKRQNKERADKANEAMQRRGQDMYKQIETNLQHPEEIVKQGQQLYQKIETQMKTPKGQGSKKSDAGPGLRAEGGGTSPMDADAAQGVGSLGDASSKVLNNRNANGNAAQGDGPVGDASQVPKNKKVTGKKKMVYGQYQYTHEEFGLPDMEDLDLPPFRQSPFPLQPRTPPSVVNASAAAAAGGLEEKAKAYGEAEEMNRGREAAAAVGAPKKKQDKAMRFAMRLGMKVAGFFAGLGTSAFVVLYQGLVEPAPPGSFSVRAFTKLAEGPMRPILVSFFADATDFTRRLTSVKANGKFSSPDAGPEADSVGKVEDLKSVVEHVKKSYGVEYVYCWHGLPAYWGGLSLESAEMQKFVPDLRFPRPTPGLLEIDPSFAWSPGVLNGFGYTEDPDGLYYDMHSYLAASGVDGVKVDCQAGMGLAGSVYGGGPAFTQNWHRALEQSIKNHFPDNHCINCMCHSTENLYRMADTAIARVSDDFYPRDPASSNPHVAACSYNSLFMSVLVMPDWDMFHSKHPAAQLHAMARAVSGGAVYVSDKPGQHDFELLRKMVLPDGTVLRATLPGKPTKDCLFLDVLRDKKSLLKVWNINAYCGVVGVFNLQGSSWDRVRRKFFIHDEKPGPLSTTVRPSDIGTWTSTSSSSKFVAYSSSSGQMTCLDLKKGLSVALDGADADVITFAPLSEANGVSFSPIGLSNMYNSGGAVLSCYSSGTGFRVSLRGAGHFLMYCSTTPSTVSCDGFPLSSSYDEVTCALLVDIPVNEATQLKCVLQVVF